MKIDHEFLSFGLTVGVRNRVAIYNHMRDFLFDAISARGLAAKDPKLFNQLTIEQQAMRLGEEAIAAVEDKLGDIFNEMAASPIYETEAVAFAASCLTETIDRKASEFLADNLFGLTWLIHDASGVAPMTREGDIPWDSLMEFGPDRDRGNSSAVE